MSSIENLSDIVDNGLCIGCGLCQSIAGKDKIKVSMSPKGRLEPKEISKISPEVFNKILNICPGTIVEGLPKEEVTSDAKHNLVWGYYLSLCYSWSTDKKIRFESSTGGLLNGLSIYLLESKKVKFIMHTAANPKKPMRSLPKFSYNKEELLSGESRSRYGPAGTLERFHEALDLNEPFAFVGKPCDISAIRQLSKKRVKKFKILKTIGAGDNPKINNYLKNSSVEIMTGGIVPKPFDSIIPVEKIKYYPSERKPTHIVVDHEVKKFSFIRFAGEDYNLKDVVIKRGELIQPKHIMALTTLGIKDLYVKKKPKIIFFGTGKEIVDYKKKNISNWQVRNSYNH